MAADSKSIQDQNNVNTHLNTQRAFENKIRATDDITMNPKSSFDNSLLQTSTNIDILSNGNVIGMIQSFTVTENRDIQKLQEVGTEGVVQAVPGNTKGGSLNVSRMALYGSNLWDAVGLTGLKNADNSLQIFQTLKNQRVPFEIQVKTPSNDTTSTVSYYIETYIDCWLSSYSKTFAVGTITVTEQATIMYADVY